MEPLNSPIDVQNARRHRGAIRQTLETECLGSAGEIGRFYSWEDSVMLLELVNYCRR